MMMVVGDGRWKMFGTSTQTDFKMYAIATQSLLQKLTQKKKRTYASYTLRELMMIMLISYHTASVCFLRLHQLLIRSIVTTRTSIMTISRNQVIHWTCAPQPKMEDISLVQPT